MAKLSLADWVMLPFNIALLWFKVFLCCLESLYRVFVPLPPESLRSKVVLITGAGGGIGRAMAAEFADHGARLALWDVNKEACDATTSMVVGKGAVAFSYACDITNLDQVKQAAANTQRDLGDVDVVVNNAGIMIAKPFLNLSEKDIRRTFEINSVAHFWILQQFLPAMIERNCGHVVTIASMAGKVGVPLLTDYCGSKYAAVGLAEALAEEMRKKNVNINFSTVCPSFVNTNLVTGVRDRAVMKNKYGRALEAEEVAKAIVEGVRRKTREILIPKSLNVALFIGLLLPRKARQMLGDFIDTGFVEVTKRE